MIPSKAPRLPWAPSGEIAETLDVSRETVNRMIRSGDFETLHVMEGKRPQYVVDRRELAGLAKARVKAEAAKKVESDKKSAAKKAAKEEGLHSR